MVNRIRLYVGSLVLLAGITCAWVYNLAPTVDGASVKAGAWFGLLCAVSGLLAYKKAALRQSGTIAFLPMLASVIVAPNWVTITSLGLATCFVEIAARRAVIKGVFNVAQAVFWVGVAILAFRYLGVSRCADRVRFRIRRLPPHLPLLPLCTPLRSQALSRSARTRASRAFGGVGHA